MAIPLLQKLMVGGYVLRQHLSRRKRYPLALMLEPLYRCNLACAGCGKIDHPDAILDVRLSLEDCLAAVDECGAPVVSIAGGEPLLHRDMPRIVEGIVARRKFVYLCTNALLLERRLGQYRPSRFFTWSVHLDGDEAMHDRSVCQGGVYRRAVAAIRRAKAAGFRVNINCTLFKEADPDQVAAFFDGVQALSVDGITVSPGYAYERAPEQDHFLARGRTKQLFREVFARGDRGRRWAFSQSGLFLDFLAGNQAYRCTPWGNPTRTVFGWQRPCYLLGEGHAPSFRALMDETDWGAYGTGRYEKCADCMVHSGYEATAVADTLARPLAAARVAFAGVRTQGPMAPEIPLAGQRPARHVQANEVVVRLDDIRGRKAAARPGRR